MADQLTEKQEQFCQAYLIDFNGAKAARLAGYSEDSARTEAWRLLTNADIQARINQLRQEMGKGFNITRERIAQELARIGFFDIRNIHNEDGSLKTPSEFADDEAAAIGGIKRSVTTFSNENGGEGEKITIEVKVWEKTKALEQLSRLMGYNAPDKTAYTDPDGNSIQPLSDSQVDKIIAALKETNETT